MQTLDSNLLNTSTRFYVRFRRLSGRAINATWLTQDKTYAREIVRLARKIDDHELSRLCDRFEELMFGPSRPGTLKTNAAPETAALDPLVAFRYVGALR